MKQVTQSANKIQSKLNRARFYQIVFLVSVLITLYAIFTLSEWAEASGFGHATQHFLIFSSGVGAGVAAVKLRDKESK